jgi:hypothetical protein
LELQDINGNVIAKWDETAGQWDLNNNSLTNIDAIDASSVTAEQFASNIETPIDVTGSRSLESEYQNTNDYELIITVTFNSSDGAIAVFPQVGNDSSSLETISDIIIDGANISGTTRIPVTLNVPPGGFYRITTGGANTSTIKSWIERGRV